MLLVESLTTALSRALARLHSLAVAVGVFADLALVAAGLRILLAALRLLLLRLRPVFSLLVAHKYPFMH